VNLTRPQAKSLDAQIRTAASRLLTLTEQAARGQIHDALGCSWRAWWVDAVKPAITGMTDVNREAYRK